MDNIRGAIFANCIPSSGPNFPTMKVNPPTRPIRTAIAPTADHNFPASNCASSHIEPAKRAIAIAIDFIALALRFIETPPRIFEKFLTTLEALLRIFLIGFADFSITSEVLDNISPVPSKTSPTPSSGFVKFLNPTPMLNKVATSPAVIPPENKEPHSIPPRTSEILSLIPPRASPTPGIPSKIPVTRPAMIKPPMAIITLEGE